DAVWVRRIAWRQLEDLVHRPIAKTVAHFFDGAAIGDEVGEVHQHAVIFAERDPARPELLENLLLLAGKRRGRIEIDGDDVGLLAALVAPGDVDRRLALVGGHLETGLRHARARAPIERAEQPRIGELAFVADAIAELGRSLWQRHIHHPA